METLRLGDGGPNTELLQTALIRAGRCELMTDGNFGPATRNAVTEFQLRHGLNTDGVVGFFTWNALNPYLTGYITKTLRPDETVSSLAERYNTTARAITIANPAGLNTGADINVPLNFGVVPTDIRFTHSLLRFCVEGLQARYPFIKVMCIGTSVLGNEIFALKIGDGPKKVLYNASHHANEWITTPVLMHFLEQYALGYAGLGLMSLPGSLSAQMFAKSTVYFVPLVNPDGVDLVTGAIPPGSPVYNKLTSMNRNNLLFPVEWKANINGTDLNLNYPAGWETARKIKFSKGYTAPGPRDYVGAYPLSEPETAAMVRFTNANDFSLTLSYHTQGEVIYWRYLDCLPPRSAEIGGIFSEMSGYDLENTPYESGHAGYKDWFIQEYKRPGYTVECGCGVSPLPISQFKRIYSDNTGILAMAALV